MYIKDAQKRVYVRGSKCNRVKVRSEKRGTTSTYLFFTNAALMRTSVSKVVMISAVFLLFEWYVSCNMSSFGRISPRRIQQYGDAGCRLRQRLKGLEGQACRRWVKGGACDLSIGFTVRGQRALCC
jgi:hypothetical protein